MKGSMDFQRRIELINLYLFKWIVYQNILELLFTGKSQS